MLVFSCCLFRFHAKPRWQLYFAWTCYACWWTGEWEVNYSSTNHGIDKKLICVYVAFAEIPISTVLLHYSTVCEHSVPWMYPLMWSPWITTHQFERLWPNRPTHIHLLSHNKCHWQIFHCYFQLSVKSVTLIELDVITRFTKVFPNWLHTLNYSHQISFALNLAQLIVIAYSLDATDSQQ